MNSVKLQKYFSDCSIMSRRAAEEEIKQGKVRVNGEVAELGRRIVPYVDEVIYNGKAVLPQSKKKLYILLNKPRKTVTTLSDEKGRPTVISLLTGINERVYPVGRLDYDSDGLLLLTNDGELTNKLTHPRHKIPKIYRVTIKGEVSSGAMALLGSELILDGYKIQPVKVEIISKNSASTTLQMTLYEGRNRQIRKMCALAGLEITSLTRTALGNITLGSLEVGKWRFLTDAEVSYLKKQA